MPVSMTYTRCVPSHPSSVSSPAGVENTASVADVAIAVGVGTGVGTTVAVGAGAVAVAVGTGVAVAVAVAVGVAGVVTVAVGGAAVAVNVGLGIGGASPPHDMARAATTASAVAATLPATVHPRVMGAV